MKQQKIALKQKMPSKKTPTRIIHIVAATVMGTSLVMPISASSQISAESIGNLRAQSAELQKKIDSNNATAEKLEDEGDSLKNRIAGLDLDISQASSQIQLTTTKINRLQKELENTQKELDRQKELLKASMRALYKRGDASTVELIVGSDSFSEFMDEQEYLERLKIGVQESTDKVITLKQQIESQQNEQIELKGQQEAARKSLYATRAERQDLLTVTEGKEAKYRDVVDGLQEKRAAVEKSLTAQILAAAASANSANLGTANNGQTIARVGMTGFTFGPHLHFELRDSNFNPISPGGYPLSGGMAWPVPSSTSIAQYFGCVSANYYSRKCAGGGSLHAGLDIAAPIGSPIIAAKPGVIVHRGDDGDGYGNKIVMKHDDGTYTLYAHLSP